MASVKKLAYEMFDKGVMDNKQIAKEIGSTESSVATYKRDWKRDVLAMLTTEEAAPYLAGEKELWQLKLEKECAKPQKKTYVAPTKKEDAEIKENSAPEKAVKEAIQEVKVDTPAEEPKVKKGLKKIVKVIEIQGDMATYKPFNTGGVLGYDIEIDSLVLSFNKQEMKDFALELLAVANEEEAI